MIKMEYSYSGGIQSIIERFNEGKIDYKQAVTELNIHTDHFIDYSMHFHKRLFFTIPNNLQLIIDKNDRLYVEYTWVICEPNANGIRNEREYCDRYAAEIEAYRLNVIKEPFLTFTLLLKDFWSIWRA